MGTKAASAGGESHLVLLGRAACVRKRTLMELREAARPSKDRSSLAREGQTQAEMESNDTAVTVTFRIFAHSYQHVV